MISKRLLILMFLLLSAVHADGAERDVRIKAEFIGPVARIFCEQGFPGPRRCWGITSQIRLPELSIIKDIRLKYRKAKQLGLRNDRASYQNKGDYTISAAIPRARISIPTGDERLLFMAEAVYDIDEDGWVTFEAPVIPVVNGRCQAELSIVEPRQVVDWELPKGFEAKELKSGEYIVKGKTRRFNSNVNRLVIKWKVKNFARFNTDNLVGDLFRFNKRSGIVQLAAVPVNGETVCMNVFVRGKAEEGTLGKVHYSSAISGVSLYSKELHVPSDRVFDFSGSDMGNVVIKNLGLHRQYLEFIRELKKIGKLSKRSNARLKAITSSFKDLISPLTSFTTYKPDSFKRISDDLVRHVVKDLYSTLTVEGKVSVTEDGWDILPIGSRELNQFYENSIKEMRRHALKGDKKTSWFFGDAKLSKKEAKRQFRTLLGAIEMVCLDCSTNIDTFHNRFVQDERARLAFLRCVDIEDTFIANKGINAYVADLRFIRNGSSFTLPELSNLFWASLQRRGYIHIPPNSSKTPFYNEFIILPGFNLGGKSDYSDFEIYCPLHDLYTKDYK